MATLRIGAPLPGNFSDLTWRSMTVFDDQRMLVSTLIGCIVALVAAVIWHLVDARSLPINSSNGVQISLVCLAIVAAHEAVHLLGFPGAGFNANTVIGRWPQLVAPYVQYRLPIGRNRFIFSAMLPVLILSILPFMLAAAGIGSVAYLSWISVGNLLGAGSGLYIVGKLFAEVPATASVVETDGKLYWA